MASPPSPTSQVRDQPGTRTSRARYVKRQAYTWSETEAPEPEQLDFVSLLTMTVALFGFGAFSLVSLIGILTGSS